MGAGLTLELVDGAEDDIEGPGQKRRPPILIQDPMSPSSQHLTGTVATVPMPIGSPMRVVAAETWSTTIEAGGMSPAVVQIAVGSLGSAFGSPSSVSFSFDESDGHGTDDDLGLSFDDTRRIRWFDGGESPRTGLS